MVISQSNVLKSYTLSNGLLISLSNSKDISSHFGGSQNNVPLTRFRSFEECFLGAGFNKRAFAGKAIGQTN